MSRERSNYRGGVNIDHGVFICDCNYRLFKKRTIAIGDGIFIPHIHDYVQSLMAWRFVVELAITGYAMPNNLNLQKSVIPADTAVNETQRMDAVMLRPVLPERQLLSTGLHCSLSIRSHQSFVLPLLHWYPAGAR